MRIAVLIVLALLTALPAHAQTATVRSGEHAGFSRLVLSFEALPDWRLEPAPGGYVLRTFRPGLAYDLSSVFDRIPRSRIAALEPDEPAGDLYLRLACACDVSAFAVSGNRLAIDVSGFPGIDLPPGPVPLSGQVPPRLRPLPSLGTKPGFTASLVSPIEWSRQPAPKASDADMDPAFSPVSLLRSETDHPAVAHPVISGWLPTRPGGGLAGEVYVAERYPDLEDRLAREIARAAAAGLIEVDAPSGGSSRAPESAMPAGNLRIEAPADRFLSWLDGRSDPPPSPGCLPAGYFAVPLWGAGLSAREGFAESRSGLLGEFDVPDSAAVHRKARWLVHLSFGAEARQLLDTYPTGRADEPVLRLLSHLVEGDRHSEPSLATELNCPTPGALWAAVQADDLPAALALDREAVLVSFLDLPPHLRSLIGPGLAAKFNDRGNRDAARVIRNAVARAGRPEEPEIALMDAALEIGQQDDSALRRLALSEHPQAAEALILLAERLSMSGEVADPDLAETAAVLARERSGTEAGRALLNTEILALILAGQTAQAFDRLEGLREQLTIGMVNALSDRLVAALTQNETDDDFAIAAFRPGFPALLDAASPGARREAIVRVQALGFPNLATRLARGADVPLSEAPREQKGPGAALGVFTPLPPDPESLSDERAKLASSAGFREMLGGLLDRVPSPATP